MKNKNYRNNIGLFGFKNIWNIQIIKKNFFGEKKYGWCVILILCNTYLAAYYTGSDSSMQWGSRWRFKSEILVNLTHDRRSDPDRIFEDILHEIKWLNHIFGELFLECWRLLFGWDNQSEVSKIQTSSPKRQRIWFDLTSFWKRLTFNNSVI